MARILLTGGAGYIGSHVWALLVERGHTVVVVDNLCNAPQDAPTRVSRLIGAPINFRNVDLLDAEALERVFAEDGPFDGVMHFAGLKAVGESVELPEKYYRNNLVGTLNLTDAMLRHKCPTIVFSSSATVYGDPLSLPITESESVKPTNPYGHTKAMIEQMLTDIARAQNWSVANLRYFNPVGAHPSRLIGETPAAPNNLVPFLCQVATGVRKELVIFGDDWPTRDGTGLRDYVHVMDLADAHVKAFEYLTKHKGVFTFNLGTGRGITVMELLTAFRSYTGRDIPARVGPRRPGDVASCFADPALAERELHWKAERDVDLMVADAWNWQLAWDEMQSKKAQ